MTDYFVLNHFHNQAFSLRNTHSGLHLFPCLPRKGLLWPKPCSKQYLGHCLQHSWQHRASCAPITPAVLARYRTVSQSIGHRQKSNLNKQLLQPLSVCFHLSKYMSLEHLFYTEKLGTFSLNKRRLQKDLIAAFHYLMWAYEKDGEKLFARADYDRNWGMA